MGGVLMLPAAMGDKSKDSIERGFRKTYEHKDAQFRVMVLRDNAKFAQAQFDPDKGQMTLSRQEQVKEVARILNMPAHKLGHDGRTAYNSLEVEEKSYLNSSLSHWLNAIRGEAAIKLLSGTQRQRLTHVFVHDLDALISTDSDTRARVGRTEIEMGALSPNEYRKQRGMPPRDGGDVFLVPLNMSPNADDPDEGSPTEADDSQDEAERQIVAEAFQQGKRATAATVIRYAKKMTAQRFVTWWDERGPEELRSMHDAETQLVRARFGVEDDGTVSDLAGQVSRAIEETTVEAFTDTIITIAENWKCATDI